MLASLSRQVLPIVAVARAVEALCCWRTAAFLAGLLFLALLEVRRQGWTLELKKMLSVELSRRALLTKGLTGWKRLCGTKKRREEKRQPVEVQEGGRKGDRPRL